MSISADQNNDHHIICSAHCGFVVGEDYFEQKTRFLVGYCPRCGAPVDIVHPYTRDVDPLVEMVLDPTKGQPGKLRLKPVANGKV